MDIFCKIIAGEIPSYTCFENEYVKCIMDANPVRPGHTLILPKKHYETILDMDEEIIIKVHETAKMLMRKMEKDFPNITGIKVLVNYGSEQVIKHYHMHLIPIYEANKEPEMTQEQACEILKK